MLVYISVVPEPDQTLLGRWRGLIRARFVREFWEQARYEFNPPIFPTTDRPTEGTHQLLQPDCALIVAPATCCSLTSVWEEMEALQRLLRPPPIIVQHLGLDFSGVLHGEAVHTLHGENWRRLFRYIRSFNRQRVL